MTKKKQNAMYYNDDTIVYFNGSWVKAKDALVSGYGQTLHYGNGVFEGIRSYNVDGKAHIFKAKAHYERLLHSAKKMHIKTDYTLEQLIDLSYELLKQNNLTDAYIRPIIYLGDNMTLTTSEDSYLLISAWEWAKYLGAGETKLMTSTYQRPNPKSCHVEAKVTGHYINSILASTEAKEKGFDEALLLDMNGFVAEGPGANFFYENNGTLYTCPEGNILPGITRATIIELAQEAGIPVEIKHFTPEEVRGADGAFFTGTAAEVGGVASLDEVPFKLKWEDSLGYQLSNLYTQLIHQSHLDGN